MTKSSWMRKICTRSRLGFVSLLSPAFGALITYFFRVFLVESGLRYDDLYDEMYDFDIMEALHRLPIQVQDLRNQRLKRAMDCGFKHNYLDKEMQVWLLWYRLAL